MGRVIVGVIVLVALGGLAILGYGYSGLLAVEPQTVTAPLPLGLD